MLDEKPNKKLMAQLRLVVRHADAFGDALRQTNIPDPNFPKAELMEHITSLKELPDGLVRGVIEIIPPIRDRLTDMKLDFLETEDAEELSGDAPPKLQRGNNLDKSIDQLLGSLSPAYTLALRQVGQSMPDEEPEVLLRTDERPDISQTRDTLTEAYQKLSEGQDQLDEILDAAGIDEADADRERLDRYLQYGKTTARVTKTELSFGQVAVKRLKTLGKALKYVPKLIKGAAKVIEFGAMVGKPIFEAFEEWGRETISSAFDAVAKGARGVQEAIEEWERRHSKEERSLQTIPPVDPDLQAKAEQKAVEYLERGEDIPAEIAPFIREIDLGSETQISKIDISNLKNISRLTSLTFPVDTPWRIEVANWNLIREHISLDAISLENTYIDDLAPIRHLNKLTKIELDETLITDFNPLKYLTSLRYLYLNKTLFHETAVFQGLKDLEFLTIMGTQVRDLTPLIGLKNLELLLLNDTYVEDFEPLSSLTSLHVLSLSGTRIEDLSPLKKLKELSILRLENTNVKDVSPLSGLSRLRELYLQGTEVVDQSPIDHVPNIHRT